MRPVLFDTSAFIWALLDNPRFDASQRADLASRDRYVSQVCGIEMAIKISVGRLSLPATFAADFAGAFERAATDLSADILPVSTMDIDRLSRLPLIHRDPFDRLIIAQALGRGLTVVTGDRAFADYPGLETLPI